MGTGYRIPFTGYWLLDIGYRIMVMCATGYGVMMYGVQETFRYWLRETSSS